MAKQPTEDWSVDEFLDGYKPVSRSVEICMDGDLYGEIDRLAAELERARDADNGTLADGTRALAEQIETLRTRAAEATRTFTVRSVGDEAWSDLKADHPATDDEAEDTLLFGFGRAFQLAAVAACSVTPAVNDKQSRRLREKLTRAQWAELFGACVVANQGDARVPKAVLASAILRSAANSATPARQASRGRPSSAASADR